MIFRQLGGLLLDGVYLGVLFLAVPWLWYRYVRYGKNRRGWRQKFWGLAPDLSDSVKTGGSDPSDRSQDDRSRKCIWLHAVSVGEVNLLAPIIERLQRELPECRLAISTTTETGYDLAVKKYATLPVFFFPFDFTWAVRRSLKRIAPSLIVLAELEIWPNLICGAASVPIFRNGRVQRGIPIAVVNGRLSEKSFRSYQRFRFWLRPSFQRLSLIAAQDEVYAQRFIQLGADPARVHVTGSVKFDGVQIDRNNELTQRLRKLAGFRAAEFVLLAGSTQLEEDRMVAEIYQELSGSHPQLRLILAPRHPERCAELIQRLQIQGFEVVRRSSLSENCPLPAATENRRAILLVDVIGELGGWWGVADAAYVGGSMGSRGGQNMLEPAAYGIPVSFGPNTRNFRAIVEQLLAVEGAVVVNNASQLKEFVQRCLTDSAWAEQMGARAQTLVCQHRGAADRTVSLLRRELGEVRVEP